MPTKAKGATAIDKRKLKLARRATNAANGVTSSGQASRTKPAPVTLPKITMRDLEAEG